MIRLFNIRGFNNSTSEVNAIGKNKDDNIEYYAENMPKNLVYYLRMTM
jgi:hypothetical protein